MFCECKKTPICWEYATKKFLKKNQDCTGWKCLARIVNDCKATVINKWMNKFKSLQLFKNESTCLMLSNGKDIIVFLNWSMKSMTLLGKRNESQKYFRKDLQKMFWRCSSILVQDHVDNLVEQLLFPQGILTFLLFER